MIAALIDGFINSAPDIFTKKKIQSFSLNVLGSGVEVSFKDNDFRFTNFQVILENLAKIAYKKDKGLLIMIDEAQNTDDLKEICDAFSYVKSLEEVKVALYVAGPSCVH
jgi:predicted AAA+ superfamily ATPase